MHRSSGLFILNKLHDATNYILKSQRMKLGTHQTFK
jgi:hypothetical protein